jgi:hypothetical protein
LLLLPLAPGSALAAAAVVDQKSEVDTTGWGGNATNAFAQSFTVGITGALTRVDLRLSKATAANVTVHIQALASGVPSGSNLATGVTSVHYYAWYHFTFTKALNVKAGGKYAIVFSMGANSSAAGSSSGDKYTRGQALINMGSWTPQAGADFAFMTYVVKATPKPTAKPTPKPTPKPSPSPTATPTATPTPTPKPSPTPVPTASPAASAAASATGAAATPGPQPDSGSGGSVVPIVGGGIVALGLGLGLAFVFVRRRRADG